MNLPLGVLGVATIAIVVASPLAPLDHHLLTAHMVQHLLLMVVAAPLILLGTRSSVLLKGLRTINVNPAFCWLAGTLTVVIWHVPAIFEFALQSHFWHVFSEASFFVAGIFFWWPVVDPVRGTPVPWWVTLYLFLATLPCDALSAFLVFCDHVVYRHYLGASEHFRLSPLEDQALAGALMWVTVTFAYMVPALAVAMRLLSIQRDHAVQAGVS